CSKTLLQNAKLLNTTPEDLWAKLAQAKCKLYGARSKRVWPGRDEKILTAWNWLMIAAFAQAGPLLDQPRYTPPAHNAPEFILTNRRTPEGRLLRPCGTGVPAKLNGYLEDYANLIDALVTLFEATFAPKWLAEAERLADVMVEQFYDESAAGLYFTGKDHE